MQTNTKSYCFLVLTLAALIGLSCSKSNAVSGAISQDMIIGGRVTIALTGSPAVLDFDGHGKGGDEYTYGRTSCKVDGAGFKAGGVLETHKGSAKCSTAGRSIEDYAYTLCADRKALGFGGNVLSILQPGMTNLKVFSEQKENGLSCTVVSIAPENRKQAPAKHFKKVSMYSINSSQPAF